MARTIGFYGGLCTIVLASACSFEPSGTQPDGAAGPPPEAGVVDAGSDALADATPVDATPADAPIDAPPPLPCQISPDYVEDPDTGTRYWYGSASVTWTTARSRCQTDGAHLAVIDDEDENEYVRSLGDDYRWIGLNDRSTEGTYVWVTGAPVDYTNWLNNEPNNGGGLFTNEDCVEMRTNGQWNDQGCGSSRRFVCECEP